MSQAQNIAPFVFISSTVEDLKPYRQAVRDAALRAKFFPEMQEYFAAEGLRPPLAECLKKVDECDLLVVIVAYRYGWIPEDQPLGDSVKEGKEQRRKPAGARKSITWLECERAQVRGKEVLAFMVDPQYDWPETLKEQYRLTRAVDEGKATPELLTDVQETVKSLQTFKNWLSSLGIRGVFTTPQDLETKVLHSLLEWRERHASEFPTVTVAADPQLYLQWLHDECAYIDIRGLQVGTGKAHKFGIEKLYIPLTTSGDFLKLRRSGRRKSDTRRGEETREMMEQQGRRIELHQALQQKYVTIIGDPGTGKTTFLRRIAFALCQTLLNLKPDAAKERLGLKQTPFPIFIRLGELSEYIRRCQEQREKEKPSLDTDPTWLAYFLAEKSHSQNWGLSQDFFIEKFKSGEAMFLLDGLDEAPDRLMRETLSELVVNAVHAYSGCAFVVTSRPKAYTGRTVLQDFPQVWIDPLEEKAMEDFLWHWSQALFYESPARAKAHHQELVEALRSRAEIRKMARNPVMLTALAVVHWNERRLPEQRAELYESIISWLLRSREQRPGRMSADQCGLHLQNLALTMQTHPKGRQVQVDRRWAAEAIQAGFPQKTEEQRIAAAERFLTEEEVDSGVVVGRGNQITFWHLTFQEYLAAKAVGGKVEEKQKALLVRPEILQHPEWREVLLLFGGVLYGQGVEKVAGFFSTILDMAIT
ncbi:MAG: DUF4062 domain-containing protein, partial [candidate division KSB1 bacterium]|nr:DUF4062 domain-containing protein [candidate division KSB1 bacterium]